MSESAKALLGAYIFLNAFAILFAWLAPDTALMWVVRIGIIATLLAAIVLALYVTYRKDRAPDFLRQHFGSPFERDGICFVVHPAARNGTFFLDIVFQNQYASRAEFYLNILIPGIHLPIGSPMTPAASLEFECDGGAFGIAHVPIAIPGEYQGRIKRVEFGARTRYPDGAGPLLRFRNGHRVPRAGDTGVGSLFLTMFLLSMGYLHWSKKTFVKIQLPLNVVEHVDPSHEIVVDLLWLPGEPVDRVAVGLNEALK